MIRPAADRTDYGDMLRPPIGYDLSFAVGTTYALELDALIGACIAMGLSDTVTSDYQNNPIYLLTALQKTTDCVQVFVERGQIKVPRKMSPLHLLLEGMVAEVKMKTVHSFHPKWWLLRFENDHGSILYRMIVLSRNLTFDRSWDMSVALEGEVGEETNENHRPISGFLLGLMDLVRRKDIDWKKRDMMLAMAEEIQRVTFDLQGSPFLDYHFFPIGMDGYDFSKEALFKESADLLILSPFISKRTIEHFASHVGSGETPPALITRRSELSKLSKASLDALEVYVLKDQILDGEELLSTGENEEQEQRQQDLHAKFYYWKRPGYYGRVYIGSANATYRGFNGNVECLLRLRLRKQQMPLEALRQDLFGGEESENPFVKIEDLSVFEESSDEGVDVEAILKAFSRLQMKAKVTEKEGTYTITVTLRSSKVFQGITLAPLLAKRPQPVQQEIRFESLGLMQLSEFFVVTVLVEDQEIHRVIKIDTTGIPDHRTDRVIGEILEDEEGFFQYIGLMMADSMNLERLELHKKRWDHMLFGGVGGDFAVFEKMLKTAAISPEAFHEIGRLMDRINDPSIVPENFRTLYETFQKVVSKS